MPVIDIKLRVLLPFSRTHVIDRQDESMADDKKFVKEEQLGKRAHNLAEPQVLEEVTFIRVFFFNDWKSPQASPLLLGKRQLYFFNTAIFFTPSCQDYTLEVSADLIVYVIDARIDNLFIPVEIYLVILSDYHGNLILVFEHNMLKFEDCLAFLKI